MTGLRRSMRSDAEAVHFIVIDEDTIETHLTITQDQLPVDHVRIVQTNPESTDEYGHYLSDHLGVEIERTVALCSRVTRFTPAVNGGILSLSKDSG